MKKVSDVVCKIGLFLFSLCLLFAFVSCDEEGLPVENYGSLTTYAEGAGAKTIEPSLGSITCSYYVVKGTHSNGTDSFEQEFSTSSTTVEHLLVGTWTVYVEGYNSDDTKIAESASSSVTINPASTTNASFALAYLSTGTGTLNLSLKVAASETTLTKVVYSIGETDVVVTKPDEAEEGYYYFRTTQNLAVGQYEILVTFYDSNDAEIGWPLMEIAHVYKDLPASKEWEFVGFTAPPVFSPSAGIVSLSDTISITSATVGAEIFFTTDGSIPTSASGTLYSSPIQLTQNTVIKAFSASPSLFPSPITTSEYHIKAASPTVSVAAGTYENAQSVVLSTTTAGSTIYYTTDGSTPTENSAVYSQLIQISHNTTVKAIAVNSAFDNSDVSTFEYHIKAAVPTTTFVSDAYEEPQTVYLSCATPNAVIYYTSDGTAPTNESSLYQNGVTVSTTQTLKAIAYAEGFDPSPVFSLDVIIATERVGAVSFSVAAGTYNSNQTVTLSSPAGTTIYYTTDGSTPTRSSTQYTEAISVSSTTTIKAIAGKWGYLNSEVVTAEYVIKTQAPTLSVASGTYQTAQSVTITCPTVGASIFYTTDGTTPTTSSTPYSEAITVDEAKTIKAIAQYAAWDCSVGVSADYVFQTKNPTMSVAAGSYQTAQSVTLACDTAGAVIYYTTDGTTPTTSSTLYTGAINVSESQTIKAIAKFGNWNSSEVVSVSYQIDGLAGFSVTNPVHYSLTIEVPDDWVEGEPVVENVAAVLTANLSPLNPDAVYTWYIDGRVAMNNNGTNAQGARLRLGTGECNVSLLSGQHLITVKVTVGTTVLIYSNEVNVSENASIGVSGPGYGIGDIGPAGGYIFYDKGSYSDGWRYLEAAPADLEIVDGVPTVDSTVSGYSYGTYKWDFDIFNFGLYRTTDDGSYLFVNGTTTYSATDCTGTSIGTGKTNTQLLVNAMGAETYSSGSGSSKTADYAARLCDILTYTVNGVTYDDWFLPSKDELNLIYVNLYSAGLVGFLANSHYWSSSEHYSYASSAWGQSFRYGGTQIYCFRSGAGNYGNVRPVRAF